MRDRHRETYLDLCVEEQHRREAQLLLQESLGLFPPPPEVAEESGEASSDELDGVAFYETEREMEEAQQALHVAGLRSRGVRRADAALEYVVEVHLKDREAALGVLEELLGRGSE